MKCYFGFTYSIYRDMSSYYVRLLPKQHLGLVTQNLCACAWDSPRSM